MTEQGARLTPQGLQEMARLGGFALNERELPQFTAQVEQLLGRLARLRELDLKETKPAFSSPLPSV